MLVVAQRVPWPFVGRLGIAFTEIVLAAAVLVGAVIIGHDLKEWRDWFWDQQTTHPWAPTPRPGDLIEIASP